MADTETITIKQNDTWPPLTAELHNENGGAIDLTTAQDVFIWLDGPVVVQTNPCTITDAPNGVIEYEFDASETATPGEYRMEFDIDFGSGKRQSVPNDHFLTLVIVESLDPAGP